MCRFGRLHIFRFLGFPVFPVLFIRFGFSGSVLFHCPVRFARFGSCRNSRRFDFTRTGSVLGISGSVGSFLKVVCKSKFMLLPPWGLEPGQLYSSVHRRPTFYSRRFCGSVCRRTKSFRRSHNVKGNFAWGSYGVRGSRIAVRDSQFA